MQSKSGPMREHENENEQSDNIEIDEEEILYIRSLVMEPELFDNFQKNMVSFIASTIQKAIIEGRWYSRMKCEQCFQVFLEDEIIDDEFINLKMASKDIRPTSKSTFEICMVTEKLMQIFEYDPKNYGTISIEVLRILNFDELFSLSDFDTHDGAKHKESLVKIIIDMYKKKRQDYHARMNTLDVHDVLLRAKLKKTVHFKGQ